MASAAILSTYTVDRQISAEQKQLFETMVGQRSVGVERVFVHMNANNQDQNDFVRGFTAVLSKDSKVCVDFLHPNMFGQTMLFRVRGRADGQPMEAADFDSRTSKALDVLNEAVPQEATGSQPSLECRELANADNVLGDGRKWVAELGGDGRIGLYRHEVREDDYEFYLFVSVGETKASRDLYRFVYTQPKDSLTVEKFVKTPEYQYVRMINQRNAQRLAAKAARALGLRVDTVEDTLAHVDSVYEVRPAMAKPCVHNEYNMYQEGHYDRKKCFYLYDNTYCTSKACGALLLQQDPRSAVLMFPPVEQNADGMMKPGVTLNKVALSFPTSIGTNLSVHEALKKRAKLDDKQVEIVNKRITWEGKQRFSTKWYNHRVVDGVYRRYNTDNEEQRRIFSVLYNGDLSMVKHLKPIIVKISADEFSY